MKKLLICITIIVMLAFTGSVAAPNKVAQTSAAVDRQPVRNVLILNSYYSGQGWTDNVVQGIKERLGESLFEIRLNIEYMDAKRYVDKTYRDLFLALLAHKYQNQTIDVIICSDDEALRFIAEGHFGMLADVPVVFCGIKEYDPWRYYIDKYTGVLGQLDILSTLRMVLQLHPDTKNIYAISDCTASGQSAADLFLETAGKVGFAGINFEVLGLLPIDHLEDAVADLPKGSVIILLSDDRDLEGQVTTFRRLANTLSRRAKVPIYSMWDFYMDEGIVGGRFPDSVAQGRGAGEMALEVLNGKSVAEISVVNSMQHSYVFDDKQLIRFGISASRLPPNSKIINLPPSLYRQDPELFWKLVAALVIMAAIIISLIVNIQKRRRMAWEMRRFNNRLEASIKERTADLSAANQQLRVTVEMLQYTQVQLVQAEKLSSMGAMLTGLAHEINTPVGIGVTAVSFIEQIQTELYARFKAGSLKKSDIEKFNETAQDAIALVRVNLERAAALVNNFKRAATGEDEERKWFNLLQHINEILFSLQPKLEMAGHSISVKCDSSIYLFSYPGAVASIIINLITNSLLHAFPEGQAGNISIEVDAEHHGVIIYYRDDGRGMEDEVLRKVFEPFFTTKRGQGGTGLGMHILHNTIIQRLSGQVTVDSEPGGGVCFTIFIPQRRDAADE